MPNTRETWTGPIGKLLADPAMRAVQKEFELSANGPRLAWGAGSGNVPKAGVVIFFRAAGPGGKQVTDIEFRANGFEGFGPCGGGLPKNLAWTDFCAATTAKIGGRRSPV